MTSYFNVCIIIVYKLECLFTLFVLKKNLLANYPVFDEGEVLFWHRAVLVSNFFMQPMIHWLSLEVAVLEVRSTLALFQYAAYPKDVYHHIIGVYISDVNLKP